MDTLTPEERSKRMSRVRGRNTGPELVVRRLLHSLGYRYRLTGRQRLPGKPDIIFSGAKRAIFVHGCFWHRHPDPACRLARIPKSRQDFWVAKLEGNRKRDERVNAELERMNWRVLTIWECELKDGAALKRRLTEFLGPSRRSSSSPEPAG